MFRYLCSCSSKLSFCHLVNIKTELLFFSQDGQTQFNIDRASLAKLCQTLFKKCQAPLLSLRLRFNFRISNALVVLRIYYCYCYFKTCTCTGWKSAQVSLKVPSQILPLFFFAARGPAEAGYLLFLQPFTPSLSRFLSFYLSPSPSPSHTDTHTDTPNRRH